MPEPVLGLALHRRLPKGRTSSLRASSCSACSTSSGSRSPIAATAPAQNTFPITAASWSRLLRSAGSVSSRAAISAWNDSGNGTSTPPSAVLVEQLAVAQHAHELLRVQRVPAGALEQQLLRLRRQHRLLQQRRHELGGVGVRKRRQADRRVVAEARAPGGMRLVQLGPRRADDQQRNSLRPVGQMLEEGQQRLVGPVDVLEHEHQRARSAIDSRNRRHAVNDSSCAAGCPRRCRAAAAAAPAATALVRLGEHRLQLRRRASGGSDSKIPAWALTISPAPRT